MAIASASPDMKKRSPTLTRLLKTRLAPIRESALLAATTTKPIKPPAGDCCGSSCKPCIMDLYKEELTVWKECRAAVEMEDEEERGKNKDEVDGAKMEEGRKGGREMKVPGAFEW